jgi:hypothetical protein
MLIEGCACRSESECSPFYMKDLLNQDDVEGLRDVLQRLELQAASRGARLVLVGSEQNQTQSGL